jgi:ankyrin repeat protein
MYACVKGRDHVAAMLLQAGAAVGLQDAQGGTALHLATMLGHPPLVPRLVQTAL